VSLGDSKPEAHASSPVNGSGGGPVASALEVGTNDPLGNDPTDGLAIQTTALAKDRTGDTDVARDSDSGPGTPPSQVLKGGSGEVPDSSPARTPARSEGSGGADDSALFSPDAGDDDTGMLDTVQGSDGPRAFPEEDGSAAIRANVS